LASYYPGWDIFLALVYFVVLMIERKLCKLRNLSLTQIILSAFVWQAPGIILVFTKLTGMSFCGLYDYAIFILEFWCTPILPLLTLLPQNMGLPFPVYYYALYLAPFIFILFYILAGISIKQTNPLAHFKH
jgi:hypothetical protein